MYFMYVDGSGQTKIKRSSNENGFYVLSGIIVHERDWKEIENSLQSLKRELFSQHNPDDWELHAFQIWNNKGFFKNINLPKKKEIFSKLIALILDSEITIINSVIIKDQLKVRYTTPKTMEYSWTFLIERYEHFLFDKPSETNNGLVFIDSSTKTPESEIKDLIYKLVRRGSTWQYIEHVIEDPIFLKSDRRNLIQLADMVAYCVNRHEKNDPNFGNWFNDLKTKMYQPNGELSKYGLKEFP